MKHTVGGTIGWKSPKPASKAAATAGEAWSNAGAGPSGCGCSCFWSASSRVPLTKWMTAPRPSSDGTGLMPSLRLSTFGSGSRLLSGPISPRKPTNASSSKSMEGRRFSIAIGCNHLSSQVDEAPMNHADARLVLPRTPWPNSKASCSMDHRTVLLRARPQSSPSFAGAAPCSKASLSTSSSGNQTTPLLALRSRRSSRCLSASFLSSPDIWSNIFFIFLFCCRHWSLYSRSTSCCICLPAVLPGSTSRRSCNVARHSSSRCMARCALALRYKALVIKWGGNASLLAKALSTDRSAIS
mmetsp:Transcript_38682/g.111779  ORF Transcript_38682/g.111779 Transcript_38682/m.111779 type:complete len:298 (+) Transcript_38682:382-1275(+)